jgi:hypothetical protein
MHKVVTGRLQNHIVTRTVEHDSSGSDTDEETNEPQEWKDLIAHITVTSLTGTTSQPHLNMALRLLKGTLIRLFETPSISKLVDVSSTPQQRIDFSVAATNVSREFGWCRASAHTAFRILCKVLSCTTIDPAFPITIRLIPVKQERNIIIGTKYSSLPTTDPVRVMLEAWVLKLREDTRCKSDLSLRNIMNFFCGACVPAFGLDVGAWPTNSTELVQERYNEDLCLKLCQGKNHGKKACWLQLFLTSIVHSTCVVDKAVRRRLGINCSTHGTTDLDDDDGADHHRISSGDLDKMFAACKDQMPQKLMFMLMITTGIRIGGLTNIRISRVAKLERNQWIANDAGRTICKGNKIYRFVMSPVVKDLLANWLQNHRPANPTPFLFPGRDGDKISTATVRHYFHVICRNAGLQGAQFRPHALRHSFAHILLESGNSSSIVAGLMNHTSSATTEKFYLRESAEQITSRANIPWLPAADKKRQLDPVVPVFLDQNKHTKGHQQKKERTTKKAKTALVDLSMFKQLPLDRL